MPFVPLSRFEMHLSGRGIHLIECIPLNVYSLNRGADSVHGLWIQVIQEIVVIIVQAVIVTVTYLLHRLAKNVRQMMDEHLASLEGMMNNFCTYTSLGTNVGTGSTVTSTSNNSSSTSTSGQP
jgi:hypothetical protein